MILFYSFLFLISSSLSDDLADADSATTAQAFMERCIDQDGDEKLCRERTIEMFGTSGLTEIDINMKSKNDEESASNSFIMLFHRGTKDKRSVAIDRSECTAPNTIYYGGKCRCRVFYDYGDPAGVGCWRCKPKCKALAICTQDRGCICQNYTVGDGYRKCETHIPHIVRAYAKSDLKTIMVEIDPIIWNYPRDAYCKFSSLIILGKLISNNTIKCVRRTSIKKDTKVDVGWDDFTFSHQKMEIGRNMSEDGEIGPIILGIVVLFFVLVVYVMFLFQRGAKKEVSLEEYANRAVATGKL